MLLCYCDGSTTWTNTYNADGLRTRRTNGSTTYSYVYNGSSLVQMTVDGSTLYFTYDASGTPQTVTYNDTVYYYVTNLQGDITAILDNTGTTVVSYTYDAWGNHTSGNNGTGTLASTLGQHNPLRYRGYVYDTETGLYYLQSRFYSPYTGRFINADAFAATGQGILGNNMFAYCDNCPVNYADYRGDAKIETSVKYDAPEVVKEENGNTTYRVRIYIETTYYGNIDNPAPPVTLTHVVEYEFIITSNGLVIFDNKQLGANYLADPSVSSTLAAIMQKTASSHKRKALSGRTIGGIARELRVHLWMSKLGILPDQSDTTHIGSTVQKEPGYDYNASWFENPFRHIPDIIKELLKRR